MEYITEINVIDLRVMMLMGRNRDKKEPFQCKTKNPTIGLILCTDKDETIVQYSVLKVSEQLFASKYRTLLPTEEELIAELKRERRVIDQRLLEFSMAHADERF